MRNRQRPAHLLTYGLSARSARPRSEPSLPRRVCPPSPQPCSVHRLGQTKETEVKRLVVKDSLEERIIKARQVFFAVFSAMRSD